MTLVRSAFGFGCLLLAACSANGASGDPGTGPFTGNGGGISNGANGGFGNGPSGGVGNPNGGVGNPNGGVGNPNGGVGNPNGGVGNPNGGTGGSAGNGTGGSVGGSGPTVGCPGTTLLPVPLDPSVRGPWVVGVRTVTVGRLTAEIVYPAAPGSEQGKTPVIYDIRDWLPKNAVQTAQFTPIADSESPAVQPIGGNLFRDLPIDAGHGPYPAVIFMHGTSSFRIASGTTITQWASRGFVVIAADYPGLMLADELCSAGCGCPSGTADFPGDIKAQIDALTAGSGDLAFLSGHVDMSRIGLSGHSVGGCTVAALAADTNVQVIIPLSSAAPTPASSSLKSTMYISGMSDTVFGYATGGGVGDFVCTNANAGSVTDAYTNSAGPPAIKKRLVGITGGGHLVPTDLCQKNADGNNAIQVLHNHHYCGVDSVAIIGLPALFDCGAAGFDWQVGLKDVDYASTAALEETLMCQDRTAQFANIKTAVPTVGDFKEAK
jgi:hypothetical protein